MTFYFRELPGICVGNVYGEIVPLNDEAIKVLRRVSLRQLLFGVKGPLTQDDYAEIEEFFLTGKSND
jgi:hypothetical protein